MFSRARVKIERESNCCMVSLRMDDKVSVPNEKTHSYRTGGYQVQQSPSILKVVYTDLVLNKDRVIYTKGL